MGLLRWQITCVIGFLWLTNPSSVEATNTTTTTPSPSLATTTAEAIRQSAASSDKSKNVSPDCQIIIKEMPVPEGSTRNGKLKMECKVCRTNGYQEECIYINKRQGDGSATHPKMAAEESRPKESVDYSHDGDEMETPSQEGSESKKDEVRHRHSNYKSDSPMYDFDARLAEVMSGAATIDKEDAEDGGEYDGDDYHGHEYQDRGQSSKKKPKKTRMMGEDDPSHFETMHSIPKEYMEDDYDPAEFEKHDEAANEFHDYYPSKSHKSAYTGGDGDSDASEEAEDTRESSESQQHVLSVMPSMDILKSFLPDVKRINPDTDVQPKKRQQKVEYVETVRYNSDDDDKDKKGSDNRPSNASPSRQPPPASFFDNDWLKGHETAAYPESYSGHASRNYPYRSGSGDSHSGQASHGYPGHSGSHSKHHRYHDDYAPPAMDSKDCKTVYKDAPNGGGKMKCQVCGSPGPKGFSEECSVDYNQPTKAHEVYYNKEQYNHDPYAARKAVYGNGGGNKKNHNHHGSSSNHGHAHSGHNRDYDPYSSGYHGHGHGNGKNNHNHHHHGSSSNHGDSHHHDPYSSGYGSGSESDDDHDDYSPTSHSHSHEHRHPAHSKPKYTGPQTSEDRAATDKIEKDIAAYFGHNVMKFEPFPHHDPYGKAGSSSKDNLSYMPAEDYFYHYFPKYEDDKKQ